MEDWQALYVTKCKAKLLEQTSCNAAFLARLEASDLLSRADLSQLKAVATLKGELDQSSLLYEILQTRIHGYEKTAKALFETKQTGAFQIFLNGFDGQGIAYPFLACNIELNVDEFLTRSAIFEGKQRKLLELCAGISKATIQQHLKNTLTGSQFVEIFCSDKLISPFVISENTIPKPVYYYVPRILSAQIELHKSFFGAPCLDVLVVKGIERMHLTHLANPNPTDVSSNQAEELNVRFILWESDDDVKDIIQISAHPVHLIQFDENNKRFVLERTWGNSKVISKYLTSNPVHLSEDKFLALEYDAKSSGYSICDTPGMGKSVLLANLARKLSLTHPNRFVAFIELSSFVRSQGISPPDIQSGTEAIKLLVHYLTPSLLSEKLLLEILTADNKPIDLFLDGFDEVHQNDLQWTTNFIKKIGSFSPLTKIVVASRPHMRRELENLLGIVGYTIVPLSTTDKCTFLSKYWRGKIRPLDEIKLEKFITHCIFVVLGNSSAAEREITGIPLQLLLLAEVYCNAAKKYSTPGRNLPLKSQTTPLTSVFGMYFLFMEMRMLKEENAKQRQMLKQFHVWTALKLLYPELAVHYVELCGISDVPPTEYLLSFGIMEECSTGSRPLIRFVHRTFAEYLVAESVAFLLTNPINREEKVKPPFNKLFSSVFENILVFKADSDFETEIGYPELVSPSFKLPQLQNPTMGYFINGYLHKRARECLSVVPASSAAFQICMSDSNTAYNFFQTFAHHDHSHLFQFLREGLISKLSEYCDAFTVYCYLEALAQFIPRLLIYRMRKTRQNT